MQMTDLEFTSHTCKGSIVLPAPVAETGKEGTCGLYMTLFLHLVLVLKVRTGQMYKDSLDKQAS